ncbi:MAG: hypothetical protein Q9169_000019 [Polycauliona sp. 2 TL-2023]
MAALGKMSRMFSPFFPFLALLSETFDVRRPLGFCNGITLVTNVGAFIGGNTDHFIPASQRDLLLRQERTQIDKDGGLAGLIGVRRTIPLHLLPLVRGVDSSSNQQHANPTPMFLKAAFALLTWRLLKPPDIVFLQTQARRSCPFLHLDLISYLLNPMTIAALWDCGWGRDINFAVGWSPIWEGGGGAEWADGFYGCVEMGDGAGDLGKKT